jgi:hypothetical protein
LYVIIPFIRTKFIIIVGTETYLANDEPLPPPARRSHTHAVCLSVCLSVCELTLSVCRSHHDEGDRRRSKTYLRPALHFHRPPSARTASTRTHTHTHTHTHTQRERERERIVGGAFRALAAAMGVCGILLGAVKTAKHWHPVRLAQVHAHLCRNRTTHVEAELSAVELNARGCQGSARCCTGAVSCS